MLIIENYIKSSNCRLTCVEVEKKRVEPIKKLLSWYQISNWEVSMIEWKKLIPCDESIDHSICNKIIPKSISKVNRLIIERPIRPITLLCCNQIFLIKIESLRVFKQNLCSGNNYNPKTPIKKTKRKAHLILWFPSCLDDTGCQKVPN